MEDILRKAEAAITAVVDSEHIDFGTGWREEDGLVEARNLIWDYFAQKELERLARRVAKKGGKVDPVLLE